MATLDELMVLLGINADDLTGGASAAADDVETALNGISADGMTAEIQAAADGVTQALDNVDTAGLTTEVQTAADTASQSLSGIATTAAGVAAGTAFAAGLADALDASAATTRLANQLGLTEAEAARSGHAAGAVFSAGFGGSIGEVNQAMAGVIASVGGMGEVTDAELQSMTRSALALADTFAFDVAESTQAVGTLMKTGMAADGTAAFDLLTAAAQKLPPAMQAELPAVTAEYGEFFDQLGFTGPEMMGLLTEASKDPLFEIDKLGDAVKEFTLRLADTEAASEPLEQLGLDVEEIQALVNEGQGTQAFDQVTAALKGVEDQTERTALQAALFGGPGEDMGNSLLNLDASSAAAGSGLDDAAGAAARVTAGMQASPAQQLDAIMRTLSTTIGETLAPVLQVVSDVLREHPGLIGAVTPVVLAVAAALAVWAAVQWALNSALLANPITWIILAVVALIAIIVVIATKTTWFQTIWDTVWTAIRTVTQVVWDVIKAIVTTYIDFVLLYIRTVLLIVTTVWNAAWAAIQWVITTVWTAIRTTVTTAITAVRTTVTGVVTAIQTFWTSAFTAIRNTASAIWNSIRTLITGAINGAWTGVKTTVTGIGRTLASIDDIALDALAGAADWLVDSGRAIIDGLISGIKSMIGALRDTLGSVTNMIPDWKGPMAVDMKLLTPSGEAIMGGLMDGIDTGVPALHDQLQGVTSDIPANVNTAAAQAGNAGGPAPVHVVLDVRGSAPELARLVKKWVRTNGRGSAEYALSTSP